MKLEEINIEGKKIGTHEVSDQVFSLKPRKDLIQLVINWQLNNQRKKKGHTKSRGEVKGSRRKIVQQKGSGGARHGNITAPIFVGGGIAHGPKGELAYKKRKLNKSEKKLSIASLITEKNKLNNLLIFSDFATVIKKTKEMHLIIKKFELTHSLIILDKTSKDKVEKSMRNIPNVKVTDINHFSAFDIIKFKKVVFTESSIKELEKRYS